MYTIVIFAWRKAGITPAAFKKHYETSHVPLLKSLAGDLFPKSHSRSYIARTPSGDAEDPSNAAHPATALAGGPEAFDYDAYAELAFEDDAAFKQFFGCVTQPENAKKIADDESHFLDRSKMTIAVIDEKNVTER